MQLTIDEFSRFTFWCRHSPSCSLSRIRASLIRRSLRRAPSRRGTRHASQPSAAGTPAALIAATEGLEKTRPSSRRTDPSSLNLCSVFRSKAWSGPHEIVADIKQIPIHEIA